MLPRVRDDRTLAIVRCVTFTACVLAAVVACREDKPAPTPPPAPAGDGIEIVAPGGEPHHVLRYQLAPNTTTPFELAMDIDLRTFDVAVQMPTLTLALDLTTTTVEPSGNAKLKLAVVGASVRARNDDPKAVQVVKLMDRQAQLLVGLVLAYTLSPGGRVSGSVVETVSTDLSGPMQEQVATLVQLGEQIAMPLPDQPIGVGARWKHRRTIKQNQLALLSVTTVDVTAIDGNRITFTSNADLSGDDQTITRDGQSAQVANIRGNASQQGTLDLGTATLTGEMRASLVFEMNVDNQRRPTRFEIATKVSPRTATPAPPSK